MKRGFVENHCDGAGPHSGEVVKRYPMGGGGFAILCIRCWANENRFRYERGKETGQPQNWPQPNWHKFDPYKPE